MDSTTLKSALTNLLDETDEVNLKTFIQNYLDRKDLTGFYELGYVVNMMKLRSKAKDFDAIINTIKWSIPSGESINKLCNYIATSTQKEQFSDLLKIFQECLYKDNPHYIKFPGDKDSYLQLLTTTAGMSAMRSFTITVWMKLELDSSPMGFQLLKCASQKSGFDAILSNRQPQGQWTITLRSFSDRDSSTKRSDIHGRVYFTLGEWHHFALKHEESGKISFFVDGILEMENEMPYLFTSTTPYKWTFGQGVKGGMAAIALYSESLSQSAIQMLCGLGPHTKSIATGVVSVPQSSFDTGHTILGTKISKGPTAHKMCRLPVIFNITAPHLIDGGNIPQFPLGRLNIDHTEMVPRPSSLATFMVPTITGGCRVTQPNGWVSAWMSAGGCAVVLYLLNSFCVAVNNDVAASSSSQSINIDISTNTSSSLTGNNNDQITIGPMQSVKNCLSFLSQFIRASAEAKEQFIQLHGFHVLGHRLSRLRNKSVLMDLEMVNLCCDLLLSLNVDGRSGDGIAAALQGLLFDFRVWGEAGMEVKMHHLFRLVDLTSERGDELEKSIGVQRLLDVLRLHILRQDFSAATQAETEAIQVACAEAGYSLLLLATEAGLALSIKSRNFSRSLIASDIEALLSCLEETNSTLLVERILRILLKYREDSPGLLSEIFSRFRFTETTAVALLARKGFSAEIYRETLALVLWQLSRESPLDPAAMLQLRKTLVLPITPSDDGSTAGSRRRFKRVKPMSVAEMKRIGDGLDYIKNIMRPALKAWSTVSMLAALIGRALSEGYYDAPLAFSHITLMVGRTDEIGYTRSPASNSDESAHRAKVINEILSLFSEPFGSRPDFWMLLPLLPPLLSHSDLSTYQQVLMSFVMSLRTVEGQIETVCNLPDRGWTRVLVDLAAIGENYSYRVASKLNAAHGREEDMEGGKMSRDEGIAVTCTELALDAAASMLEHKVRYHDQDAWSCWNCLMNCIKASCATFREKGEFIEKQLVKRCLSLVFQRLARSSDPWNLGMLIFLENILTLISNKNLCGQELNPITFSETIDSDSTQTPRYLLQTLEEQQLLLFVVDVISSLRRAASKQAMYGRELGALRLSMNVLLNSLRICSDSSAERIVNEVASNLSYVSRCPTLPLSPEDYKQYVILVFTRLEGAILDPSLDAVVRQRYQALVHRLCGHFGDLRKTTLKRIAAGVDEDTMPAFALPTLEALSGIENCHDVESIFELFRITLVFADTISFDTFENFETDEPPSESSRSLTASSAPTSVPVDGNDSKDLVSSISTSITSAIPYNPQSTNKSDEASQSHDELEEKEKSTLKAHYGNAESIITSANTGSDKTDNDIPSISALPTSADFTSASPSTLDPLYVSWVKTRQGIVQDRVDSERLRLSQCMQSLDLSTAAVEKHWTKLQRKVESESFLLPHPCQWKLGVAHEGAFPGRRRLVLRPRFELSSGSRNKVSVDGESSDNRADDNKNITDESRNKEGDESEGVKRALAKACAGYIQDVARMNAEPGSTEAPNDSTGASTQSAPGDGWGVIGADGSEEGFGVIGLASGRDVFEDTELQADTGDDKVLEGDKRVDADTTGKPASTVPSDMNGDLRLVEEAMQQGRRVDTGPCHTGTRRMSHGPPSISAKVILVTASGNFLGTLSLAPKDVYFISSFERDDRSDDSTAVNLVHHLRVRRRRWTVSSISAVYLRRYRLRETAIEVFFRRGKHRHFFVDFGHTKEDSKARVAFARALMEAAPTSAFKQWPLMSPFRLVSEHRIQDKWIRGEISNFEYLMALNTISGRSFNDLCQYHVMPWVLSDYTSTKIDLSDPRVYRDLSKPMGALNEARLQDFLDRYYSFGDNETVQHIPPFMYGSHYSTMVGVVLHFLIRLQPFASLHKEMQGGRFDVADRLFSSIPMTFLHNTTQLSEVKELTPEWFTTPEMFRNVNNFDFGITQDGDRVGDVQLPPWARSAEHFVYMHRQALESEYVSAHLHEWIDLIFGYKQVGPAAVEANNVFYYLTYAGSVDRQLIADEGLRKAVELQIAHFGQIPQQLFRTPHPARQSAGSRNPSNLPRPLPKCFTSGGGGVGAIVPFTVTKAPLLSDTGIDSSFTVKENLEMVGMKGQWATLGSDEEHLAILSKCSMLTRRNPSLSLRRTGSTEVLTATRELRPTRQAGSSSDLAVGNILSFFLCTERVVAVIDSGVIEVYKYMTSDSAKNALIQIIGAKSKSRKRPTEANDKRMATSLALASDPDIISFDDHSFSPSLLTALAGDMHLFSELKEPVISVERDTTHFEILPRIPIAASLPTAHSREARFGSNSSLTPLPSSLTQLEACVKLVHFSRSGNLLFSAGHVDGSVYVREIDSRTGFIISAGDFLGHRHRVASISSDFISGSNTDVVASCDFLGQVLVWTVSLAQSTNAARTYIISRRPQRMFRGQACLHSCIDVSWQMGIVAMGARGTVRLFSIEREELLRIIDIAPLVTGSTSGSTNSNSGSVSTSSTPSLDERSSTLCISIDPRQTVKKVDAISTADECEAEGDVDVESDRDRPAVVIERISLCNDGIIVLHVTNRSKLPPPSSSYLESHSLIALSLSGYLTGYAHLDGALTYMDCINRGDVVIAGFADGRIALFNTHDLQQIYEFRPWQDALCVCASYSTAANIPPGPAAIVCARVGPNELYPAVLCASTSMGEMYFRPLPDFIRWEKTRLPSALSQMVSAPLQAVRGTIQQATSLGAWTSEQAGALAHNAKSFADETLSEWTKKGKFLSSVGNFFGVGKNEEG